MSAKRRYVALVVATGWSLLLAGASLGAPGGGSGGFGGGGGGGGGGGYSGGGGGYRGTGSGDGEIGVGGVLLMGLVLAVVLVSLVMGAVARQRRVRRRAERVSAVELAAVDAVMDDAAFAPEVVKPGAVELHRAIVRAWNANDRQALGSLIGADLLVEWGLRLDDFERKGWRSITEIVGEPEVEYVGLVNRSEDGEDRVTVRLEVPLRDVVYDRHGDQIARNDDENQDGLVTLAEYWTLGKRDGRWTLVSIEQDAEGSHHLDAPIVSSPWSDDRLRDVAVTEQAAATALSEEQVRSVADLDFDGTARSAALDMASVDGRFDPDVMEAAARRAIDGWAEAVDGDDSALDAVATPEAAHALLHPGDPSGRTRLVVRGLRLLALRIVAVEAAATPPAVVVEADVSGRRYVEDRDTTTILSGSRDHEVRFTERWRLVLDDDPATPWRITRDDRAPTSLA